MPSKLRSTLLIQGHSRLNVVRVEPPVAWRHPHRPGRAQYGQLSLFYRAPSISTRDLNWRRKTSIQQYPMICDSPVFSNKIRIRANETTPNRFTHCPLIENIQPESNRLVRLTRPIWTDDGSPPSFSPTLPSRKNRRSRRPRPERRR